MIFRRCASQALRSRPWVSCVSPLQTREQKTFSREDQHGDLPILTPTSGNRRIRAFECSGRAERRLTWYPGSRSPCLTTCGSPAHNECGFTHVSRCVPCMTTVLTSLGTERAALQQELPVCDKIDGTGERRMVTSDRCPPRTRSWNGRN